MFRPALILLLLPLASFGQVANNQISSRLQLELDAGAMRSTTAQSTVEWKCINKKLTNKCLVYHNDQWFSFRVKQSGTYYLNLSSQQCKSDNGVQLILIEGNPCQVDTYRIMECIPQIRLEDVFVEMDSLKTNTEYLVNVDGFLGDLCEFEIELASKPRGLPRQITQRESVPTELNLNKNIVSLQWRVTDSIAKAIDSFHIYRKAKGNKQAQLKAKVGIESNAYGAFLENYAWQDTLTQTGTYTYQIFGIRVTDNWPILLHEQSILFEKPTPPAAKANPKKATIALSFANNTRFSVIVYDQATNEMLTKQKVDFEKNRDSNYAIDFSEWIDGGKKEFLVLIMDEYTLAAQEFYFTWSGEQLRRQ